MSIPAPGGPLHRRTNRPFPARRHLPGEGPHPASEGFVAVPDDAWARDLFDHRFFWEAHEVWEATWASMRRTSPEARFYQGLICAAAFVVKHHQGFDDGASRLLARARTHLTTATTRLGPTPHGIDVEALLTRLERYRDTGAWPTVPEVDDV